MTTVHKFACRAMNTRFEFMLEGADDGLLRAAAEEAFHEIERLERMLSVFLETSEVASINRNGGRSPIRISSELMLLLKRAQFLSQVTHGAFDITVGPLVRCWRQAAALQNIPTPTEIDAALMQTGMTSLELDEKRDLLSFHKPGMQLDFGAIGKGFALERAAEILVDAGVESGLLHGGTSSVLAIGRPHEMEFWPVGIAEPTPEFLSASDVEKSRSGNAIATARLHNNALSVSAVWGKGFKAADQFYGHVLDPRTGLPVQRAFCASVVVNNPTDADALSTAMLVLGEDMLEILLKTFNSMSYLLVLAAMDRGFRTLSGGLDIEENVR